MSTTGQRSHFEVHTGEAAAFSRASASAKVGSSAASANSQARSGLRRKSTNPGQAASITGASPPTSNSQSASMGLPGLSQQKTNRGRLSPVNLIAPVSGKIGAVAAMTDRKSVV